MNPELAKLLDGEGKLTRWPSKNHQRLLALEYLASKFVSGEVLTEKAVNERLNAWHTFTDHALLRRELFIKGLLQRTNDGHSYWKD